MKALIAKKAAMLALAAVIVLSADSALCSEGTEMELKQHLVSFFQRGGNFTALPETHPLRPLELRGRG